MNNLALKADLLAREIEALKVAYPELAEDDDLRFDTVEGETDAETVLAHIVDAARDADAMQKAIKLRRDDLSEREARYKRRSQAMRGLAMKVLQAIETRKFTLPEATLSVSKGRFKTIVDDEDSVPTQLTVTVRKPDLKAIGTALDQGEDVPGVHREIGPETLTIRAK